MGEFAGKVRRQNTGAAAAAAGDLETFKFHEAAAPEFHNGRGWGLGWSVLTLALGSRPCAGHQHLATPPLVTASILGIIFSPEVFVMLSMEKLVQSTILR